jgi:hypothetical protein
VALMTRLQAGDVLTRARLVRMIRDYLLPINPVNVFLSRQYVHASVMYRSTKIVL